MRTRPTKKDRTPPRRQRGFYMLEVLVSVLILAIGLLGLAALQSRALRYNHDAYVRSQAAILANDITERMRSVRGATAASQVLSSYATVSGGTCNRNLATAQSDVKCWKDAIAAQLPGGQGTIVDNGDSTYAINISWVDRDDPTSITPPTLSWTVRP
jgi:type IV pilus assembly protein PilV